MIPPWRTDCRVRSESLGSELITDAADRDFSGGPGNWNILLGNDITFDNIDCDWNCDETNLLTLSLILTEGALYKLQFDITAYTSGDIQPYIGNTSVADPFTEAVSTIVLYGTAGPDNHMHFSSSDFIGSIDNISLKKVL